MAANTNFGSTGGGLNVDIVKNSKFKGVSPSQEMGFDVEPTAPKVDIGSSGIIAPPEPNVQASDLRTYDEGRIQYEDESELIEPTPDAPAKNQILRDSERAGIKAKSRDAMNDGISSGTPNFPVDE